MKETSATDIQTIADALIARGVLARPQDRGDLQLWFNCELASRVEGCFAQPLDPRAIPADKGAAWRARLGLGSEDWPGRHAIHAAREHFFLMHDGHRVGSLRLAPPWPGHHSVWLYSLYTFPELRRRGLASRALQDIHHVALAHGFDGLRLSTHWTWSHSVRFYLAQRMWVWGWKRDISFWWDRSLPDYRIDMGSDDEAVFKIVRPQLEPVSVFLARRDGTQLSIEHGEGYESIAQSAHGSVIGHGLATLSLSLAMLGWPLIRSQEQYQRCYFSDSGPPEALAYKIEWFEAQARDKGWAVRTPRIPGLRYRTLEEMLK